MSAFVEATCIFKSQCTTILPPNSLPPYYEVCVHQFLMIFTLIYYHYEGHWTMVSGISRIRRFTWARWYSPHSVISSQFVILIWLTFFPSLAMFEQRRRCASRSCRGHAGGRGVHAPITRVHSVVILGCGNDDIYGLRRHQRAFDHRPRDRPGCDACGTPPLRLLPVLHRCYAGKLWCPKVSDEHLSIIILDSDDFCVQARVIYNSWSFSFLLTNQTKYISIY